MENEEMIVKAIHILNEILQSEKLARVTLESDSDWDDGMKSIDISVRYYPNETKKD